MAKPPITHVTPFKKQYTPKNTVAVMYDPGNYDTVNIPLITAMTSSSISTTYVGTLAILYRPARYSIANMIAPWVIPIVNTPTRLSVEQPYPKPIPISSEMPRMTQPIHHTVEYGRRMKYAII